jgi:hypothetical protein
VTDAPAADSGPGGVQAARTGGCLCGGVRYRLDRAPLWVAHCHCSMCRRAQGAGFVTWAGFAEDALSLDAGEDLVSRYQSSAAAARSFCRRCGTPLFFQSSRWPGEIHVTLASLDSAEGLEPQAHAYWSSRVPWLGWDGGELPRVEPDDENR